MSAVLCSKWGALVCKSSSIRLGTDYTVKSSDISNLCVLLVPVSTVVLSLWSRFLKKKIVRNSTFIAAFNGVKQNTGDERYKYSSSHK